MRQPLVLALLSAVALAWVVVAAAAADDAEPPDRLHLHDGRTFEGQILGEDDRYVRFNAIIDGVGVRLTVDREDIREIDRTTPGPATPSPSRDEPAPDAAAPPEMDLRPRDDAEVVHGEGPAYAVLPIRGDIGLTVQAGAVLDALAIVHVAEPELVILPVSSDGGMVQELDALLALIAQWRRETGIPLVALIEDRAYSAAAILAAACDELYMTPGAVIGSAMAMEIDEDERQWRAVDEKFASAYRARSRAAAEQAGRDGRLIEAMIDPEVALAYSVGDDGPRIHRLHGAEEVGSLGDREMLVASGRLLTLTAHEAVRVGLAEAVVDDLAALLARHGLDGGHDAAPRARQVLEQCHEEVTRSMQRYEQLTDEILEHVGRLEQHVGSGEQVSRRQYLNNLNRLQRSLEQVDRLAQRYPWIATRVEHEYEVPPSQIAEQTRDAIQRMR